MAPSPGQGFETNVTELEAYAATLPQVADALRKPIAILTEHTPTPRPMEVGAVYDMEFVSTACSPKTSPSASASCATE
jgi:hypothetical protein